MGGGDFFFLILIENFGGSQDLSRLYNLFSRVPDGLIEIANKTRDHIQQQGMAIVSARESRIIREEKEKVS